MKDEKWTKLTGELTEGPNFFDLIMESIREAARQGIKADSIVINRNMVFVPEKFGERPAMVCGLNAYLSTDDLPDTYSFAVLESKREKTNADRIRAMSDEELAAWLVQKTVYQESAWSEPSYLNFLTSRDDTKENAINGTVEWLKQPAEGVGE